MMDVVKANPTTPLGAPKGAIIIVAVVGATIVWAAPLGCDSATVMVLRGNDWTVGKRMKLRTEVE